MRVYAHQYTQNPMAAHQCACVSSDLTSRQSYAGDKKLQLFFAKQEKPMHNLECFGKKRDNGTFTYRFTKSACLLALSQLQEKQVICYAI